MKGAGKIKLVKELESVQGTALTGISGALSTKQTMAFIDILQVNIAGKCIVANVAIRKAGHIKGSRVRNSEILSLRLHP